MDNIFEKMTKSINEQIATLSSSAVFFDLENNLGKHFKTNPDLVNRILKYYTMWGWEVNLSQRMIKKETNNYMMYDFKFTRPCSQCGK